MSKLPVLSIIGLLLYVTLRAQSPTHDRQNVPIYSVTVIERTVKAVNYQYRNGPTPVDFRGTVLLPQSKGDAVVESKAGRTEVDAHFERLEPPTRFGPEYLTYVLWAITPEGHAKNLGEVLANGSDHAKMHVTTDLQAFGMIVTAEPYSAVRDPSNVVVMENEIRPDTVGRVEQIEAKYELLPRGHYTYNVPADLRAAREEGEKLPMDRYESLLEVYQAQNAVQIAQAAGADRYASDTFAKAQNQLRQAQEFQTRKADRSTVVSMARAAAQTAEDARTITVQRKREEELAQTRDQLQREQALRVQAESDAQRARNQASAERAQLESERIARQQAENQAEAARMMPPQPPVQERVTIQTAGPALAEGDKKSLRARVAQDLNTVLPTLDTPKGVVVTITDSSFRGGSLSPVVAGNMSRVAAVIAAHPGLYVQVDGHTDNASGGARDEEVSYERAAAVRDALARAGVPASAMSARGLGSSRPITSNATASGREQNRRVEITISGDPIGSLPYWDKTYSLAPR